MGRNTAKAAELKNMRLTIGILRTLKIGKNQGNLPWLTRKGAGQPTSHRVSALIRSPCPGYCLARVYRSASSKSAKSNPGATGQPTRAYSLPSAGTEANQLPARIIV